MRVSFCPKTKKMHLVIVLLFRIIVLGNFQQIVEPPDLVWHDEFNYEGSPNPDLWTYDEGNGCPTLCGWGNDEQQFYTSKPENVRVEDGNLVIETHKERINESPYTSTRLKSKGKGAWKYGYIEVRAKLPQGRGTWPAIWMLPEEFIYGGWPASGEIDIMEHVGYDPGVIHGTVHTADFNHLKNTQVGKQKLVEDFDQNFHLYAVNWTENTIEFYIDGNKYHEFKNNGEGSDAWPFDHPFHIILNIAVGGGWGGQEGIDENIWPQKMEVDYVRVYEPLVSDAQKAAFFQPNQ